MSHWGVKSYENDLAAHVLDAGFESACGARYEELMNDKHPLPFEQVQAELATPQTLWAAVEALQDEAGLDQKVWDAEQKLAFVGVIVRHAELGVLPNDEWRRWAIDWLENEEIEWDQADARARRKRKEIALLQKLAGESDGG
jgi:hypothetical protein